MAGDGEMQSYFANIARGAAAGSVAIMEMGMYQAGHLLGNSPHGPQILDRSAANGLGRAEMMQEGLTPPWPDAGNLVQRIAGHLLAPSGPVRADGEAVRLVAQTLDEIK